MLSYYFMKKVLLIIRLYLDEVNNIIDNKIYLILSIRILRYLKNPARLLIKIRRICSKSVYHDRRHSAKSYGALYDKKVLLCVGFCLS